MANPEQNLSNHTRIVPLYHVFAFMPMLVNFVWSLYRLSRGVTGDSIVQLVLAIGLLCLTLTVRFQILTVQDRVIRNEMRERLARVLPATQHAAIAQLSRQQLVALRFASDGELSALVAQVLAGQLPTQKAIKSQVKDWQADFLRA